MPEFEEIILAGRKAADIDPLSGSIPSGYYVMLAKNTDSKWQRLSYSAFVSQVNSVLGDPATPITTPSVPAFPQIRFATGTGTYSNFLSGPATPIVVDDSDGIVYFQYNLTTTYWQKISIGLSFITSKISGFASNVSINVNSGSKTIDTVATGNSYVTQHADIYPITSANTALIHLSNSGGYGLNVLVYKKTDHKIYAVNYTNILSIDENYIVLGNFYDFGGSVVSASEVSVDGANSKKQVFRSLVFDGRIRVDRTANKVIIPSRIFYLERGKVYVLKNALADYGDANAFTFNLQTANLVMDTIWFSPDRLAAGSNPFFIESAADYNNGNEKNIRVLQMVNSNVTSDFNIYDDADFPSENRATCELILPPKFFLLQGETLPLYKNCIVRSTDELKNEMVLMVSGTDTDLNLPLIESFEVAQLTTQKLSKSTVRIYSKKYQDTAFDYGVDVQVVSTTPGSKAGNYNHLQIGDSLSNRGVTKYTKNYLAQFGIITTGVGTLNNSGQLGEGREGWTFKNFIGADNYHTFLSNAITPSTSGTTTNMDTQNPFLKIATSGDKAAHPDWCFRNTGVHNELSYTTDTVKTGTFYIFDFAAYLSNHSVPTPNVVTIALSTNDLTFYGNTNGVTSSLLGAEIIISQIRAALPTVPIGIIPNVGFGDNNQTEWSGACDFINQLNTKLTTMALSNVNVVGVWASMDKRFAFDYSASANLRNDGNLTKKFTKNESIHFNLQGYLPYAKTLGAYIANVI